MSLQNHDAVKGLKHVRRPKKTPAERARRQKAQKKRLVALGVPQEVADKMSPLEIRNKLTRPARVKRELEAAKAAE
ncbi:MAG: hypothetical protein IJ444_00155 [Kiritimatiellae bacterium]|jgi:hypothetical protein|nr:hypothetical protein [Kiritimatiellia bacterium]MBO7298420.1 hypothetical protein [Kiritimatiellia bacterium]MBQ2282315.1 hypothetical protein [Kiritimatiellia bacterium]MBQ8569905.1 hypothetical protein [Kiritimatiellia bacterium]